MRRSQKPDVLGGFGVPVVAVMYLASVLGSGMWLATRKLGTVGRRAIDWQPFASIAVLLALSGLTGSADSAQPGAVAAVVLAALALMHWLKRDLKAPARYVGRSIFGDGEHALSLWEPLAFALGGAVAAYLYMPLGLWMLLAAFASHLFHGFLAEREAGRDVIGQEAVPETIWRKRE